MMLGPPIRGNDPLHVVLMALALVAAAFMGAALGFVLDFSRGEDAPAQAAGPQAEESQAAAAER